MRLFADGGELTVLRSLAAFAYGGWSVEWPESVPDEQRPVLPDERDFGFVSRLAVEPGRMGRRFVRDDVSIEAFEVGPDGVRLPESGFSDVEETLDAAASRTAGDTFFEFEFTREHLGELTPFVDFGVGDLVEVVIWGRSLVVPVVSIDSVSEQGAVVDWRVRVGGTLVGDRAELDRSYREIRRDLLREQRERRDAVSEAKAHTDSAVAQERTERQEDVAQVREVLGGPDATDTSLLSQLAAVQAQITGMGERPAQPGLLAAYLATNTALWKAQQEIDRLQNERTDELTAQLIETQKLVERARVDVVTLSRSELPWVSDLVRVRWSDAEGVVVEPVNRRRSHVVATVSDGDASRVHVDTLPTRLGAQSMVLSGPAGLLSRSGVVGLMVRGAPGVERRLTQTIPGQTTKTTAWMQVAQITVPERTMSAVASLRIRWAATGYKDVLGVRVRVAGRTLLEKTGVSTGSPLQMAKAQLHTAGDVAVQPGDVVIFECKNEAKHIQQMDIAGGEALLAVIEQSEV